MLNSHGWFLPESGNFICALIMVCFICGIELHLCKKTMRIKSQFRTAVFLGVLFFCTTAAGKAQLTKDSLLKAMSKDVCEDMAKKDFKGKNAEEIQMEIGLSFLPVMGKYTRELREIYGEIMDGTEGMEKAGEDLGMRLVLECPAFLQIMTGNPGIINKAAGIAEKTMTGTLIRVVPGEFTHLLVKDNKGKLVKIWWMAPFAGSAELTGNPQSWLNKKVTVSYDERESYNAGTKKYTTIKTAAGIEKL
jgi:hypothetical protein